MLRDTGWLGQGGGTRGVEPTYLPRLRTQGLELSGCDVAEIWWLPGSATR